MYPREVNLFPVTHFHVERNGIIVENDLTESVYVDLQGDANQSYGCGRSTSSASPGRGPSAPGPASGNWAPPTT